MKNNYKNEEIDLLEILHSIWISKFKIILSTLITIIAVYLYYENDKPTFLATTEIKPISTFEEFEYNIFNDYSTQVNNELGVRSRRGNTSNTRVNFNRIDKDYLYNLLIDKIKEGKITTDAIKKLDLIDRRNYINEQEYENAVLKLASSITVIPVDKDSEISTNWNIVANVKDIKQWNKFLKYIDKALNESVRIYLAENLQKKIINEKKFIEFKINDIDQIISNSLINYENVISAKIAYLEEQAKIARTLKIPKNTLSESQSFEIDTLMITTLASGAQIPYYSRGYEVIEKEIELIQKRTNVNFFIPEIISLKKEKKNISVNKIEKVKRIEALIKQTPIMANNNFVAGRISYLTTSYKNNKSPLSTILILTALFGFVLSTLYFLLEGAIKKRL